METTSESPTPAKVAESSSPGNPKGTQGRLIFFGPKETIRKLKPGVAPLGEAVDRKEIKEMTIEYVSRVTSPQAVLDIYKEPMTLLIEKADIDALFSTPGCTGIVALLAVETKEDHNRPHQTFVLMPCDNSGTVIGSTTEDETEGRERWPILRNVRSVVQSDDIARDVEIFLKTQLHI